MTEQNNHQWLESKLYELYTTPEPTSMFTGRLRAQVLERAERRGVNWFAQFRIGMTSARRVAFNLAGMVLLVGLLVVGAKLMATLYSAESGANPTPAARNFATAAISTETAKSIIKQPQLAPSACENLITPQPSDAASSLPEKLLGGGIVQSGDFHLSLYLFCDPLFQPQSDDLYSEIAGLGIYQSYLYTGPDIHEPRSTSTVYQDGEPYTIIHPAVSLQSGSKMSAMNGILTGSSAIPDWTAPELPMRYLYKIPGEQGKIYGASLSFRLVNGPDGFTVHEVVVKALNDSEVAQSDAASGLLPTYPTVESQLLHPLLGELKALQERQREWLYTSPGWYFQRMQWKISGDPYADFPLQNSPKGVFVKEYLHDAGYEVDERGYLIGQVNRYSRTDPRYGYMILDETGSILGASALPLPPVFDESTFSNGVEAVRHGGEITKQVLPGGVQYTITTNAYETQVVFDPRTGKLIEVLNYTIRENGEKVLYSTGKAIILKRVDEPGNSPWPSYDALTKP